MLKTSRIFVAGHRGLVGSNIVKVLKDQGYTNVLTAARTELDLTSESQVKDYFAANKPEYVFLAAAKVGGIMANSTYPVEFLENNLRIQNAVISASYKNGVKKLLFLGSSCIYPKLAPQPMKEEYLLSGPLEPTNQWYALAKIAGIKLCQAYSKQYGFNAISVMPTNLYGPGDNFDLQTSHVLPAMIRKFVEAKEKALPAVEIWGTGAPKREFLYVEDLAESCVFLMNNYNSPEIINVGTANELSIAELANLVKEVVGYAGDLTFDTSKPDGTPRKLLDVSRINQLGWAAKTPLNDGVRKAVNWYLENR